MKCSVCGSDNIDNHGVCLTCGFIVENDDVIKFLDKREVEIYKAHKNVLLSNVKLLRERKGKEVNKITSDAAQESNEELIKYTISISDMVFAMIRFVCKYFLFLGIFLWVFNSFSLGFDVSVYNELEIMELTMDIYSIAVINCFLINAFVEEDIKGFFKCLLDIVVMIAVITLYIYLYLNIFNKISEDTFLWFLLGDVLLVGGIVFFYWFYLEMRGGSSEKE